MHYIRGEYLAETDPASGALELETVATNRGCTAGIFSYVSTLEEYQEAVLKDARKEFLGEGQLYYFIRSIIYFLTQKPILYSHCRIMRWFTNFIDK